MTKKSAEDVAGTRSEGAEQSRHQQRPIERPKRNQAPFAVTSDGTLLMNVDALDPLDVAALEAQGWTLFVGAELRGHPGQLARELFDNAGHEICARIAGPLVTPRGDA